MFLDVPFDVQGMGVGSAAAPPDTALDFDEQLVFGPREIGRPFARWVEPELADWGRQAKLFNEKRKGALMLRPVFADMSTHF